MTEYLWAVQDDHRYWGFISSQGIAVPPQFDYVCDFSEGLAEVKVGDKWGFINRVGETVVVPQFDCTGKFSEGLASVRIGHQWGAIDPTGQIVIPLQFDLLDRFSEGLAIAYTGGTVRKKWDDEQLEIHKMQLAYVYPNEAAEAAKQCEEDVNRLVIDGGMWGVVDKTGNFVIPPRFKLYGERDIEDMSTPGEGFKNGILKFYGPSLISAEIEVNADTKTEESEAVSGGVSITIEPVWDEDSNEWREALICSVESPPPSEEIEKYGFINRAGDIVIEPVWDEVSDEWRDGLLRVRNHSDEEDGIDEYIFLKPGGEVAFTNNVVDLRPFHDGMAVATNEDGLKGCMNVHGQLVIDCQFQDVGNFSEGLAEVTHSSDEEMPLYGYIDKSGEMVILEQFISASGFCSNGLAVVKVSGEKYGLIDKTGKLVLSPKYDWLFPMTDYSDDENILYEFCEGEGDDTYGVIDSQGNIIIEPIYRKISSGGELIKVELAGAWGYEPKIYFNTAGEIVFQSTPIEP
jgi:WG containing repeat